MEPCCIIGEVVRDVLAEALEKRNARKPAYRQVEFPFMKGGDEGKQYCADFRE